MEERRGLTFGQAEGREPLPTQLALRTIDAQLAAVLWAVVHESLIACIGSPGSAYGGNEIIVDPWKNILRSWWVVSQHENIDEFPDARSIFKIVKHVITFRDYVVTFNFIQFVIQNENCPARLRTDVAKVLDHGRSAYRVIEDLIVPISSDEQASAIRAAMAVAAAAEAKGPRAHLRNASQELTGGKWAESIRESISAVEAAAKSIKPGATTLGAALNELQLTEKLNPALARGFSALYGFTSSEHGIRHSLVDAGAAAVDERDAIFMFGACATFVGYLLSSGPRSA